MRIQKQKNRLNKRNVLIFIIVALLVCGGYFAYSLSRTPQSTDSSNDKQAINYNPPTEQETADSQNGKKNSAPKSDSNDQANGSDPADSSPGKRKVDVGVAFADVTNNKLEIRAFTNNIIESGTCTATVTQGSKKATRQASAFIDASSTQCEAIFIPKSDLANGKWSVVVEFLSPNAYGKSDIIEVDL